MVEDYEDEEQDPQLIRLDTKVFLLNDGEELDSYEEFFMDNHKEEWFKAMLE